MSYSLIDIFLQILKMSITASIVILLVLLIRVMLRKTPKVFSYALWAVVLFRLVCPVSFESDFSLLSIFPDMDNQRDIQSIEFSLSSFQEGATTVAIETSSTPLLETPSEIIQNGTSSTTSPTNSVDPQQVVLTILAVIWVIGILVMLLYSIASSLRLSIRVRGATHLKDNIYLVANWDTPFVMGLFNPRIYLPETLSEKEQLFVLHHEQTHIKHLDHVTRLVSFLALTLHWFNPLVWIAFHISGKDMEMACDEAVIKAFGTPVKKEYTTSLLALATGKRYLAGAPLAFGVGDTKGRIKNILNYNSPSFWLKVIIVAIIGMASIGLLANPTNHAQLIHIKSIGLSQELLNQVTACGLNTNTQSLQPSSLKVSEVVDFIETLEVNKSEINQSRADDRDLSNQIILSLTGVENGGKSYDIKLNFSSNFDEVWIDNGLKPSFSYRVSRPAEAKIFFENQLGSVTQAVQTVSAQALWNARTPYVGDNSAVSNLISLMILPENLSHDSIQLYTDENQRGLAWILIEGEANGFDEAELEQAALLLLSLIDNLEDFYVTVREPSGDETEFHYDLAWANQIADGNVKLYAESPEKLQDLIDLGISKFPVVQYSIVKLGQDGTEVAEIPVENRDLAEAICMDYLIKSSAWEGKDITTLKESYRIRQVYPQVGETYDYYAYLLDDGTPVLQSGLDGRYSTIAPSLYEQLVGSFD